MDRQLDPHLRQILTNATGYTPQSNSFGPFEPDLLDDGHDNGFSFGPVPRQTPQPTGGFNDFCKLLPLGFGMLHN